jgi:hypothetical protein
VLKTPAGNRFYLQRPNEPEDEKLRNPSWALILKAFYTNCNQTQCPGFCPDDVDVFEGAGIST